MHVSERPALGWTALGVVEVMGGGGALQKYVAVIELSSSDSGVAVRGELRAYYLRFRVIYCRNMSDMVATYKLAAVDISMIWFH